MKVCDVCQSIEAVRLDAGELGVEREEKDRLVLHLDLCDGCVDAAGKDGFAGLVARNQIAKQPARRPRKAAASTTGPGQRGGPTPE